MRKPQCAQFAADRMSDKAPALVDWEKLGNRIRRAAMSAAALHLLRAAGGRLDAGAVLETPRVISSG